MTITDELRLLCNDNELVDVDTAAINQCARKFGVPIVAAYRRAKELGLLSYQQPPALSLPVSNTDIDRTSEPKGHWQDGGKVWVEDHHCALPVSNTGENAYVALLRHNDDPNNLKAVLVPTGQTLDFDEDAATRRWLWPHLGYEFHLVAFVPLEAAE